LFSAALFAFLASLLPHQRRTQTLAVPHMGQRDRLHDLLGWNGSGVAMMTYLG